MAHAAERHPAGSMTPEGIFVVHLRSDSALAARDIHGRVEHVQSGEGARFGSVAELLAFMARYTEGDDASAVTEGPA